VAETGENPAERRSDDEAKAERRTDQAHALGAILSGGDVCDVRLGSWNVAAGDAADDACHEHQRERVGQRQRHVRGAGR